MAMGQSLQFGFSGTTECGDFYKRRNPEDSFLYRVVQKNWKTFLEQTNRDLPHYIIKEFESYLQCGVLANGFLRLKCESCRHEKLVSFSCKKRGFCPSCCGRRMAESGVFLSENVFPRVLVRQWVISFPIPLRFWMASNPRLMNKVLEISTRAINSFYKKQAKARLIQNCNTGSVTLIQRFGGSVNLNIHFHELWMEGVFIKKDKNEKPVLEWIREPSDDDVLNVLKTIQKRLVRLLIRRGLLADEKTIADEAQTSFDDHDQLNGLKAASTQNRLAMGENAGQRVRRVGGFGEIGQKPKKESRLCASLDGFSLHANVLIEADKPEKLEKLCRYVSRPPVAEGRLFKYSENEIGYFLKNEWHDGTFAVKFSPLEFIEKLVALIPPPRIHLTRFFGVLAPHHAWRSMIVPTGGLPKEEVKKKFQNQIKWAELLKRVFKIDITVCPECNGKLKFISVIIERRVVVKILEHLQLPSVIPRWDEPRPPPSLEFSF